MGMKNNGLWMPIIALSLVLSNTAFATPCMPTPGVNDPCNGADACRFISWTQPCICIPASGQLAPYECRDRDPLPEPEDDDSCIRCHYVYQDDGLGLPS